MLGLDYNLEDRGWTSPYNPLSTWRHMRPLQDVEEDLKRDLERGDRESFVRHMHQGQDSFTHPRHGGAIGHVICSIVGDNPDNPTIDDHQDLWNGEDEWTRDWETRWILKWL